MEPSSQTTGSEEKKYVTLETGSKLSGYTQEYLERLCRLKKVDYRIWNNGQFVIELGSLLRETQTILLSNDGISFVDKGELADPVPEVVGSMLSSALKEVTTTVATPEVTTPVAVPLPNVALDQVAATLPVSDSVPTALTPEAPKVAPAPLLEVSPVSASVIPPPIPVPPKALATETKEEQIQPVVAQSISVVAPDEAAPAPEPMITRTPIARAPIAVPTPPRPIRINTAVENIATPASVTSPISLAPLPSPIEDIHIPTPQAESSIPVVAEKEVAPTAPSLEAHIPPPQVASPVKQTVPFGSLPGGIPAPEELVVSQAPAHDEWDAMLFGGAPAALDTVSEPVPAPVPERASPVNREYHPIQTSVDPRPHHDDGPLFPVLNPSGVVRPDDVQAKSVVSPVVAQDSLVPAPLVATTPAPSPVSGSYGSGQRVVVYEPKDLLSNEGKGEVIPPTPPVANAPSTPLIPKKPGAIYNELPTLPQVSVIEKPIPVVPSAIIRKEGSVPSLRVMPALPVVPQHNLPMKMEEHHLIVEEEHSLMKNVGLNLAFAAVLIGSSVLLLNSTYPELGKKLGDIGSTSYIAGVGAALTKDALETTAPAPKQPSELELPFSDEVIVDLGSKQNSVIVRPVFKTGTGGSYEYAITPIATTSVNLE